ncbi:uncharacterized protein FA14DRAFT_162889 [Meira miltonrushii]|uniref:Uncharacterized protein n=1 Tax=Meira miltonrushii TaxID=1280837 RepID=A0A316V0V4_9BASI|nr:uncharacterized protein FA14DRAFT_162889 [Meira miltonrushii]PWN31179.1 hypothetical protein FA14DRAFT_162889 [Meira miltonrushii]
MQPSQLRSSIDARHLICVLAQPASSTSRLWIHSLFIRDLPIVQSVSHTSLFKSSHTIDRGNQHEYRKELTHKYKRLNGAQIKQMFPRTIRESLWKIRGEQSSTSLLPLPMHTRSKFERIYRTIDTSSAGMVHLPSPLLNGSRI